MAKPRTQRPVAPIAATAPVETLPPSQARFGERELLATGAVLICILLTWLSRTALNPDGVSYLDLAGRAMAGDWSSFVQGYWSPLYPALVALIATVVGRDPVALLATAHAINGVAAIAVVLLLWWWSRGLTARFFPRAAIAALLLVSAGLPRIEAVTPDVVLLALMAWIGYELLARRGERWLLVGVLLGLAFLAKTSAWPWLIVTVPLRLWGAADGAARRRVALSSVVALVVMLTWIVPLSRKYQHLTLGSSGRLNYCWYLQACDSRTPDTHLGRHSSYQQVRTDSATILRWAEFPDADKWTYAPWSDPTAWEVGIVDKQSTSPATGELIEYWGRQFRNTFGLWLLPLLLGILVPVGVLQRRPGMWRALLHEQRHLLVTALLGLAGVMQFVMIHSEPRLIAPFALLFALAVLQWLATEGDGMRPAPPMVWQGGTLIGLLAAIGFAVPRLKDGFASGARIDTVITTIARNNATMRSAGISLDRLVILGPAIPVEASAFLSGAHIVAQMPPTSVELLRRMSAKEQERVVTALFQGKADVAWLTTADAGVTMLVIPKVP